ncbi:MAG: HAMP domain-containing sensor histidine kinase [Vicinamibacterales bacterium]
MLPVERHSPAPDAGALRDNERLGFFVHDLRNLIQTAMVAFEMARSADGDIRGATGDLLHRSLLGARDLISRSLAEVRLTHGAPEHEPFLVSALIEELLPAAKLTSEARGLKLTVGIVEPGVAVAADRHLLEAVLLNLLQNAFKFTRPGTTIALQVEARGERVAIHVQDECGGLRDADANGLFQAFEQRSVDRSGFGLGLAFSQWATEAMGGRISVRNLPGEGCVFTVDLPRCPTPSTENFIA